jgi:hypothetical protein
MVGEGRQRTRRGARRTRSRPASVACVVLALVISVLAPVPSSAATQVGYRAHSFAGFDAGKGGSPTGEKPESKLWHHDGSWWAAMVSPSRSGAHTIHRLSGTTWVDTGTVIDADPSTKEDVLADGNTLYIVSRRSSKLNRFTYASGSYRLDSGFPVSVPAPAGAETLTLARDTTGVLWITWEASNKIWVARTTGDDRKWGAAKVLPFTQASGVSSDDISSVIAFQDATGPAIGVMWSHQPAGRQHFAVHRDGAPEDQWSLEVALEGTNEADDHINLKTFDGRVFAVVKTEHSTAGKPQIRLLVRSATGSWDKHVVAAYPTEYRDVTTRPITVLQIDEVNRHVYVFMTLGEGSNRRAIVYKRSNISQVAFPGDATVLIQGANGEQISNATSMKANATAETGIVVLASDASNYWWNRIGGTDGGSNGAPVFDGVLGDRSDVVGASVSVSASATDPDGDVVSYAASGLPAGVAIDASTGLMSGTLSAVGEHAVEVSASDGTATSVARFSWTVTSAPTGDGYASVVLGDGPAAYWRLGELSGTSAADASGNGFGGVYSGGFGLGAAGAVGDGDAAVDLDGVSGKVSTPFPGVSGSGERTVEAWIRTTSSGAGLDTIVEWGASNTTAGARWTFRLHDAGSKAVLRAEVQGGYAFGSTRVDDGAWHHVAVVLPAGATDVSQVRFYVDGVADPVAASVKQAVRTDATVGLAIGDSPSMAAGYGIHRYFDGVVDEVAVYPVALSATQISEHHQSGVAGAA